MRTSVLWLGSRPARDDAFRHLADVLSALAEAAHRAGGALHAPGVVVGPRAPVLAGDTHVLEVLSPVEQEVACNLLRLHVPTVIAMAGRGVTVPGRPPERIGSRWLAESRGHLAARFLASATPEHLERVKAELRRSDGVAQLERMDVAPGTGSAMAVTVRCVDAAASIAALRAHALVLSAVVMQARRQVREGRRTGHTPQRLLEENRARAVASGLQARFVCDDLRPTGKPGPDRSRPRPAHRSAEDAVRALLSDIAPELRNLDAGADELAPVLLPADLARFGGPRGVGDDTLLWECASGGEAALLDILRAALTDHEPGGPLLRELRRRHPGLVAAVLRSWDERIEGATARGGGTAQRDRRKTSRPRRPGGQGRQR